LSLAGSEKESSLSRSMVREEVELSSGPLSLVRSFNRSSDDMSSWKSV
jgi:hypothetical protein